MMDGSTKGKSVGSFTWFPDRSASAGLWTAAGRAYTISVIASLSRRCYAGTTTGKTSGGGCPFYPLHWCPVKYFTESDKTLAVSGLRRYLPCRDLNGDWLQ